MNLSELKMTHALDDLELAEGRHVDTVFDYASMGRHFQHSRGPAPSCSRWSLENWKATVNFVESPTFCGDSELMSSQ